MTSALNLARLAALVAIFGFFLPWAEVSCSGQPLTHKTGIELITGAGASGAGGPTHHDLWVAASLGLVVLGLVGCLIARERRAAAIVMAAALAAAVASLIGISQEVPSTARQAGGEFMRAKLEYGYFVTLGGLIVAIVGGGLALTNRRSRDIEPLRPPTARLR